MRKILLLMLLSCGTWLATCAEGVEADRLTRANDLYGRGEYLQAAELYEAVLAEEGVSPYLYYNLGNAYYKAGETGRSVLNYERALRLDPRFADARHNLSLAQNRVIDNIKPAEVFFVKRWVQSLVSRYTSNQWFYLSWGLFVLALAACVCFVFARSRGVRKASFVLAIVLASLCALSLVCSATRKAQFLNRRDAVVMTGIVTVKSSPDRSGTDLFELHEGTKVSLKSTLGDWVEIVIGDGRIGWAEKKHLETI